MIRMNPGIGAGHHEKVITAGKATKFGISPLDLGEVKAIAERFGLKIVGVNQHIGSCFMEAEGYLAAARELLRIAEKVQSELGVALEVIDFGGGFGIPYRKHDGEARLDLAALGAGLDAILDEWCSKTGYDGHFHIEPGRYLVAECGVLLGRVTATKYNGSTRYAGTDIGFNQLMRPILYDSYHEIEICGAPADAVCEPWNVVGNICESGDILARGRMLPPMKEGDTIAVLDAGAYGYVMASSYNQRPRPAEVMIGLDGEVRLIRRRETIEDLLRLVV
jgi:diaminopimelate decarboxylase